jgi:hypothetical protein
VGLAHRLYDSWGPPDRVQGDLSWWRLVPGEQR